MIPGQGLGKAAGAFVAAPLVDAETGAAGWDKVAGGGSAAGLAPRAGPAAIGFIARRPPRIHPAASVGRVNARRRRGSTVERKSSNGIAMTVCWTIPGRGTLRIAWRGQMECPLIDRRGVHISAAARSHR